MSYLRTQEKFSRALHGQNIDVDKLVKSSTVRSKQSEGVDFSAGRGGFPGKASSAFQHQFAQIPKAILVVSAA